MAAVLFSICVSLRTGHLCSLHGLSQTYHLYWAGWLNVSTFSILVDKLLGSRSKMLYQILNDPYWNNKTEVPLCSLLYSLSQLLPPFWTRFRLRVFWEVFWHPAWVMCPFSKPVTCWVTSVRAQTASFMPACSVRWGWVVLFVTISLVTRRNRCSLNSYQMRR